jgi:hypothetical protein
VQPSEAALRHEEGKERKKKKKKRKKKKKKIQMDLRVIETRTSTILEYRCKCGTLPLSYKPMTLHGIPHKTYLIPIYIVGEKNTTTKNVTGS